MITRLIAGFLRIHRLYDLRDFPEIDHFDYGYFRGKFQKSYSYIAYLI